ncbi:COR domain-containing protein [Vibrio sp. M260112]|uniref:COR domain-containing protein n=1 Tax=Vibrio sp. M260112 TaxID=3020895 RepID=UPI002F3F7A4C
MFEELFGLPELTDLQIEELHKFLHSFSGYEFEFEYINIEDSDFQNLSRYIEIKYVGSHTLKIINNCLISIEDPSYLDNDKIKELIDWLCLNKIEAHVIGISKIFNDWSLLYPLYNLVSVQLWDGYGHSEPGEFPNLTDLTIDSLSKEIVSFLGLAVKNIQSLEIEGSSQIKVSTKLLNEFISLNLLMLNNETKVDFTKLLLSELRVLSTNQVVTLDDLSGCPNISYLRSKIDTNISQKLGPSLVSLNVHAGGSDVCNLDNIKTDRLKEISYYGKVNLSISKTIPTVDGLTERNNTVYYENNNFKISILSFMPNLRRLVLRGNKIDFDIYNDWVHFNLESISAISCGLDSIDFVRYFPKLSSAILTGNKISNIEVLKDWDSVNYINLSYNQIIDIPKEVSDKYLLSTERVGIKKSANHSTINITGNPLISPPIEIVERGSNAIKPYFESMVGETEELNEAKIVFLGNGEVGKTSLMKALSGECFDAEEETTHGINIKKYSVPINEQCSVDASIWDFGGQQIMHATHQLFLSRRCVYVLVINDRKDDLQQEQKINYWLQQVQTFGGNSKVIIIRNKSDMFSLNNVPEGRLKEKYPNLVAIEPVSCKTGHNLERVRNLINEQVRQLPMRKVRLAKNWIKIKEEIKALSFEYDHLPLSRFSDICNINGVTDFEAQKTLRDLLHDLSVIIAFEELDGFDMGILNPHWITDGIYTLINSEVLEKKKGYIKLPDVQAELDKVHPGTYSNKARFIVESMMQFELCHPVGSTRSGTYLVPNLLPNEIRSKKITYGENTIKFLFKYDNLLPPSIIPSFLVRMSKQISDDKRWRTGAILTDTSLGVQAIVEEDSVERELKIVVSGTQVRDFFSVIRHEIRNLNEPNTKALGVRELVPLNGRFVEYVDYEELIGLEVMGKATYTSGKLKEDFSVSRLLSGIESREETESSVARQRGEDINVTVEVKQGDINIKTGDQITNTTVTSEQSQTVKQSQKVDIKVELKRLKGTGGYVIDDLKSDAEYEISNEVDRERFVRECDRVKGALSEIEQVETPEEADEKVGHFMRVHDFLNNALDNVGPIGESVAALGSSISKVRDLAKTYNKVASFFGLPVIPELLLS